jgi:hypothetical protein
MAKGIRVYVVKSGKVRESVPLDQPSFYENERLTNKTSSPLHNCILLSLHDAQGFFLVLPGAN